MLNVAPGNGSKPTVRQHRAGYNKEFLPKVLPMIKEGGGEYVAGSFNKTHSLSGAAPYSV